MNDNTNGRRWARCGLVIALFVSIVANVTHAVLADSEISLWLRIPGAVVWPAFTFLGIEILVRVIWERRWSHHFTRVVLLSAAVPAAVTSYEHQYSLLGLMGENLFIQAVSPLAIDGLMIGCTMALLFTRSVMTPALTTPAAREVSEEEADAILARYEEEMDIPDDALAMNDAFDSPPPIESSSPWFPDGPKASRSRISFETQQDGVRLLLQGVKPEEVAQKIGAGASTVARWAKVTKILRANPDAQIDYKAERVTPELVEFIRTNMKVS